MRRPPSPAQRAVQITFTLKGHLKNVQVAYIRVAALLARVRDEKLYRALGHATMDAYAAARLGLQHAALYRYLEVYDWIREFHRPWLERRPRGFIPQLTDAYALMWIERRLQDPHLGDALRAQLEALRRKALAGQLTLREFQEVRRQGHAGAPPLRAALTSVRAVRRRLAAVPGLSAQILGTLDTLIGELEAALATTRRIARLAGLPRTRPAAPAVSGRRGAR